MRIDVRVLGRLDSRCELPTRNKSLGNQSGGAQRPTGMNTSRSRTFLTVLCVAALPLLAAGCGSDASVAAGSGSEPDGDGAAAASSYDGEWELIDGEVDGAPFTPIGNYPITLEIAGDEVRGSAGCNSFGGGFTVDGDSVTMGDVSITEMACADQEPMEAEQTFIQAFWQIDAIERTGSGAEERLVLSGANNTLNYAKAAPTPTTELIGTLWILDTIIDGDSASSTIADVEEPTLKLAADGSFVAITGCREIIGSYTLDGQRFTPAFEMDDYACDDELDQMERPILAVLEQTSTATVDGQRLTLTADDGRSGLSYRAAE